MKFKFDANQEYQIEAIEAAASLFEGLPRSPGFSGFLPVGDAQTSLVPPEKKGQLILTHTIPATAANTLSLDEDTLLANLGAVQARSSIPPDAALACIEETIETAVGEKKVRFPNFSVEMETGTGKTYVYLRTALELYRRFELRKFIIVVPSVAIREGVLKTLEITHQHLRELYDNIPYRYFVYDSGSLSQIRQFSLSDSVELMVMTIDSFNKASNVIRQTTDRLQGDTPIHLVQATRPVLILDEPQNMESELRIKALSALDPLFALRYSATHRNPYNVVHKLSPYEAYRQGLVKRIEVAGVEREDDANQVFLRLEGIKAEKTKLTARIALHKLMKNGTVKEKTVKVCPGDSLEKLSGRSDYQGFDVDEINKASGFVRFTNDVELSLGESRGAEREAIFEAQIRYTIEEHFRKQEKLADSGIKVLSLFFIDRVANYAEEDGIIRRLFFKLFNELKKDRDGWSDKQPADVQAAYFAAKRHKGGVSEIVDSVSGKTKEDEDAYNLIMKDKERLLSFDEPVSFIFSHSALREGWDNPNVFQICTLNQTASEVKKRQEVGRGVRLCVDQQGDRIRDERLNILTVVANESYERYVGRLQSEFAEEYGSEALPPPPANARRRGVAKLKKQYTLKPEFKELWERIKHKTRYAVKIDSEKLLEDVLPELNDAVIRHPRIVLTKGQVQVGDEDAIAVLQMSGGKTVLDLSGRYPLPNIVDIMAELMEYTTPPVKLTRRTLFELFKGYENKNAALDNPHEFAATAVRIIKEKLTDHMVSGIKYEKINEWYEMTQLVTEIEGWMDHLIPADHSVYDHVLWESEVEKQFVEDLENRGDVKLYIKLPDWFTVPTPVGEYNPDWAIVLDKRNKEGEKTLEDLVYMVRETKAENWRTDARPNERRKIKCGKRHFKDTLGVDYEVVTKASELR